MDKNKIPFYASELAQSFIDFELSEYEKNNIHTDIRGYSIDDIGLYDAVNILVSHDIAKARKAAGLIKDAELREAAERDILCFEDRCIR